MCADVVNLTLGTWVTWSHQNVLKLISGNYSLYIIDNISAIIGILGSFYKKYFKSKIPRFNFFSSNRAMQHLNFILGAELKVDTV